MIIIQVIWKKLYKTSTASDHGTLYQLRNLVQRRNVGNKPKKDFNAHDSFFNLVITCHILAATMEVLGMDALDDKPCELLVPENVHTLPKSERSTILSHVCDVVVHSYIDLHHSVEVKGRASTNTNGTDPSKYDENCLSKEDHSKGDQDSNIDSIEDEEPDSGEGSEDHTNSEYSNKETGDNVQAYAKELLTLGLLYSEFSDGIREGDGDRVIRCWKFLMLIFKAAQRKNYSCEAFALLAQMEFILSPRLSKQLKCSRFINTRGGKGRNIPCDLHMEHLNRILKDGVKGLGANKTDKAITRLGKCVHSLDQILTNFDESLDVHHSAGFHTVASLNKDVNIVVKELTEQVKPFSHSKGRSHRSIKITKPILKSLDSIKFHSWMEDKWNSLLAGVL